MSDIEKKYLIELLVKLKLAKNTLEYSYNICQAIGEKDLYSQEEADRFESLTSKFARLSDLIARAEKKGLIAEEFKFIEIRKKRNEIAHEYIANEEDIINIYKYVLNNCKYLFDSVDKIEIYTKKFFD